MYVELAADDSVDAGSAYATSLANQTWSETKGYSGGWVPAMMQYSLRLIRPLGEYLHSA